MPIPKYDEITAPLLAFLKDTKEHNRTEMYSEMAKHFKLSNEEIAQLLPSGKVTVWVNRCAWAVSDLTKANLISKVSRSIYKITKAGIDLINSNSKEKFDRKFLAKNYKEFRSWMTKGLIEKSNEDSSDSSTATSQTPEEKIENAYKEINASLVSDIKDTISKMNPFNFEQLVLDLIVAMGYGGSRDDVLATITPKSNDEGIDGVINEDRLGLDVIYLQAKRWQASIGRKEIQSFVGALSGKHANKGIFITTSEFNKNAYEYAKTVPQKVILIDGNKLAMLMIEYNIGVSQKNTYQIKHLSNKAIRHWLF